MVSRRAVGSAKKAAIGFSVHTGWAAMTAMAGPASPVVLDRRRLEMIPGHDPEGPPFVYHAARGVRPEAAERFIRQFAEQSERQAKAALEAAVAELRAKGHEVAGTGLIVSDRPLTASLPSILASHALIHAAEGELYRGAIRAASEALGLPVRETRAKDVRARAAAALGVSENGVDDRLGEIGRAAGRPWAKDQKDACLVALIALAKPVS